MPPGKCDISIYQGDTFEMLVTLQQDTTPVTPFNLAGCTAKAQLRTGSSSSAVTLEFTCAIPTPANGIIKMAASATATAGVPAGRYIYDLQITNGVIVETIIRGTAIVTGEVTRP